MSETILVTGASGHLGRAVVRHLLETQRLPPARIIAATREPAKLGDFAARGVDVRAADFDAPADLSRAFAGATKILMISTDLFDLTGGRRRRQHEAAVDAAKRAGAAHIAYTSMPRPEPGSPFLLAGDHYGTEQAIRASGLAFTIFRPNAYFENLLTMSLPGVLASGRWATCAGDGRVAYVARDEMAQAIAAYLGSRSTGSATVDLAGPVAYSNAEVARLVTKITGRPIEVVAVTEGVLVELLEKVGIPEPFARLIASGDETTRRGDSGHTSDILETLLHRKPQSLEQFLEAHRSALMR